MPILPYPRATYPTSVRFFEPVMYYSAVVGRLVTELGLLQTRHVLQTDGARGKGIEGGPSHFWRAHGPFGRGERREGRLRPRLALSVIHVPFDHC